MGEKQFGQFVHAVAVLAAVEDIAQHHRVVGGRDTQAMPGQHFHIVLDVLADLQHRVVQQHVFQRCDGVFQRQIRDVAAAAK